MRRLALLLALGLTLAGGASSAQAAQWHSQQPVGPGGFPTPLGQVGDVECLRADDCVLISAGNSGVAAGLFAYDGRGWYRYSTVCGGQEGRIAWAGPDEFWTISDQQKGQQTGQPPPSHISLCHFKGDQVVASYAEPVGRADSYVPMDAAACASPSDCWFAGQRLPGTVNQGAFHLHWNGTSLTALPSLTAPQPEVLDPGRSVGSVAYHQGAFYESVLVRGGDTEVPAEEESEPALLHRLAPGTANPFKPLFPAAAIEYGEEGIGSARELGVMHLTGGDGEPLWAIAGANGSNGPRAKLTVLRLGPEDQLTQLALADSGEVLAAGDPVKAAAAEPGEAAWVGFEHAEDVNSAAPSARLTRIQGDGTVGPEVLLPAAGEEIGGEAIGPKGQAGPIACAAAEQCWMATLKGWLFHLGTDPAPSADPALRPAPITVRPADDSLPVVVPISPPEDDSGAKQAAPSGQEEIPSLGEPLPKRRPAIVADVKQRLVGGTTLELSFTLRKQAHVRLVASRKGHVVAQTRRYTMAKGRRSVRLRLDPKRWPTKLDLQVHPVKTGKGK